MSVDRTACPGQPFAQPGAGVLAPSRTLRFWLDPANLAARLEQAGPVVPTRTGPATAFQINDPALLRKVGSDEDTFRFWGPDPSLRDFNEDGVVGLEGAAHRERRAVMRPAFTASRLTALGPSVQACTRRLLADLPADRPLDMRVEMSFYFACGLLVSCLLNSELAPDTLSKIATARSTLSGGMFWRYALAPWPWVPVPRRRACSRALAELDEAVRQVRARHRPDTDGGDLVSLLEAAAPGNPHVVQRDIRALLISRHGDERLHPRLGLLRTGPQSALPAGAPGRSRRLARFEAGSMHTSSRSRPPSFKKSPASTASRSWSAAPATRPPRAVYRSRPEPWSPCLWGPCVATGTATATRTCSTRSAGSPTPSRHRPPPRCSPTAWAPGTAPAQPRPMPCCPSPWRPWSLAHAAPGAAGPQDRREPGTHTDTQGPDHVRHTVRTSARRHRAYARHEQRQRFRFRGGFHRKETHVTRAVRKAQNATSCQ